MHRNHMLLEDACHSHAHTPGNHILLATVGVRPEVTWGIATDGGTCWN